jgi:uncharacterized membrane protein
MRPTLKTEFLPLLFILASWGLLVWYWPQLPDPMPTHWGIDGRPDSWMPKPWGAFVGPLATTFVYVLMLLSPFIDPRKRNWEAFGSFYPVLKTVMTALMLFITYLAFDTAASTAQTFQPGTMLVGIGLLFVVLGNYMPKVRSNFFVGIRTPWTLSSDDVWVRTHRLAGKLMVLMGLLFMSASWLPPRWAFAVVMSTTIGLVVVTFGYSYWLFRRQAHL